MDDPYFLTLAGLTLAGILFAMASSIGEAVATWRRIRRYTSQLPPGDFIPADCLCPILGIDAERLKDFTGKKMLSRFEAEEIIRNLVTREWWQL